jgi:signal transduction histidine kinase/CheY-like chemotaxis protein
VIGEYVRAEQVRTLYRHTTPILIANSCNALIVGGALWDSASRPLLLGWGMVLVLTMIGRGVLGARYARSEVSASQADTWGMRFALGSVTSGVLWGTAGVLFFGPASPLVQLLISFVVGGMCAAAAGTLAVYSPAFLGFVVPALGALFLHTALSGSLYVTLAALIAVYGLALSFIARNNRRALTQAFVLRFENAELLKTLSHAQSGLQEANYTLERRVAERTEALQKHADALRDARRLEAVGRLAGGVAHDFNNLLTVILANVEELASSSELDDSGRDALRDTRDAASRAAQLVRQLLTFSRRQPAAPETIDLNQIVSAMERLLSRLLGERVSLRFTLCAQPLIVHIDPVQVEQVIMNLVTNARDAMPQGGVVQIETERVEATRPSEGAAESFGDALLSVRDTGMGMDTETRERIFEPFFTTKEVGKGSGLGLATTYGIVEQGGGRIEVSSELGQGSCFRIHLPLAQPGGAAVIESGAPPRRVSGTRAAVRPRAVATILLVEDESSVRTAVERMLSRAGHHVLVAQDAVEALALSAALAGPLDLLVTDVVMPGLDGPALAERVRAARPELRTLFISGYSRDHAIRSGPEGTHAFLPKPFSREALLAQVAELLAAPSRAASRLASRA